MKTCAIILATLAGLAVLGAIPFLGFLAGRWIYWFVVNGWGFSESVAPLITMLTFLFAIAGAVIGGAAGHDAFDWWREEQRRLARNKIYEQRALTAEYVRVHQEPERQRGPVSWGDAK